MVLVTTNYLRTFAETPKAKISVFEVFFFAISRVPGERFVVVFFLLLDPAAEISPNEHHFQADFVLSG